MFTETSFVFFHWISTFATFGLFSRFGCWRLYHSIGAWLQKPLIVDLKEKKSKTRNLKGAQEAIIITISWFKGLQCSSARTIRHIKFISFRFILQYKMWIYPWGRTGLPCLYLQICKYFTLYLQDTELSFVLPVSVWNFEQHLICRFYFEIEMSKKLGPWHCMFLKPFSVLIWTSHWRSLSSLAEHNLMRRYKFVITVKIQKPWTLEIL